ncbi:MAG: S-layer homology domain-containing protein, partial [Pseudomonadota bacterium]
ELNKVDHYQYLQGYPDNTVRPEGKITREEVAAVFYRLLTADYRGSIMTHDEKFTDVEANKWSTLYIATLANGGILEGNPDGTFKPHNYITKAELAAVTSRFDNLSPFEGDSFTDIAGHWANKYINSAAKKGWVKGNPDGTFEPDKYITRAEFATLVNNVLERRVHKANILKDAKKFPDLLESKWYYEAMMEAINSHFYTRMEDTYEEWTEIYYPDLDL